MVRYLFLFGDAALRLTRVSLWADESGAVCAIPGDDDEIRVVHVGLNPPDEALQKRLALYGAFGSMADGSPCRVSFVSLCPRLPGGKQSLQGAAVPQEALLYRALFGEEEEDLQALMARHSEAAEAVLRRWLTGGSDPALKDALDDIRDAAESCGAQVLLCAQGDDGFACAGMMTMLDTLAQMKQQSRGYLKLGAMALLPDGEKNGAGQLVNALADRAETGVPDVVSLMGCPGWQGGAQADFMDLPAAALMLDFFAQMDIPREPQVHMLHLADSLYTADLLPGAAMAGYQALVKASLLYRYEMLPVIRERLASPSLLKDRQRGWYAAGFGAVRKLDENHRQETIRRAEQLAELLKLYTEDMAQIADTVPAALSAGDKRASAMQEAVKNYRALLEAAGELADIERTMKAYNLQDDGAVVRGKGPDDFAARLLRDAAEKRKELQQLRQVQASLDKTIGGMGKLMLMDRMLAGIRRALAVEEKEAARREMMIAQIERDNPGTLEEMEQRRVPLNRLAMHIQKLRSQQEYLEKERQEAEETRLWAEAPEVEPACTVLPGAAALDDFRKRAVQIRKDSELYQLLDDLLPECTPCRTAEKLLGGISPAQTGDEALHQLMAQLCRMFRGEEAR
ncbi:MAG: hypothetical protein Q4C54_00630 [Clostridia bacterium]|nr:hypothetical protein [Clostridia bacterium]